MRLKLFKEKKGFTLIELILYLGLFSIFLTIVLQLFSSIFDIQIESEATSSVGTDGKYIIQRFTHDVNSASSISIPASYGVSENSLTMVIDGETIIYSLNGDNLQLANQTLGTADQLNSSETSVSSLTFLRLDGGGEDSVRVSFTLTSDATRRGVGSEVESFQTTAGTR